jgi:DNA polymerase III subunit alpha
MAFIKMEDHLGEIELILFPGSYQRTLGLWERDRVVLVRGKISAKDREGNIGEELKILVDDAREITPEQAAMYTITGRKQKPLSEGRKKVSLSALPSNNIKGPAAPAPAPGPAPSYAAPKPAAAPASATLPAVPRLYIRLANTQDQNILMSLKEMIDDHTGQTDVVLVLGATKQVIKLPSGVQEDEAVIGKLRTLVGAENVKLQ